MRSGLCKLVNEIRQTLNMRSLQQLKSTESELNTVLFMRECSVKAGVPPSSLMGKLQVHWDMPKWD